MGRGGHGAMVLIFIKECVIHHSGGKVYSLQLGGFDCVFFSIINNETHNGEGEVAG